MRAKTLTVAFLIVAAALIFGWFAQSVANVAETHGAFTKYPADVTVPATQTALSEPSAPPVVITKVVQAPPKVVTKTRTVVVTKVVQAPPVTKVVQAPAPKSPGFAEDSLPAYLTDFADETGADLHPFELEGHTGCWMAEGPTSRVACPDGFQSES